MFVATIYISPDPKKAAIMGNAVRAPCLLMGDESILV
jgi:hypothetical protein